MIKIYIIYHPNIQNTVFTTEENKIDEMKEYMKKVYGLQGYAQGWKHRVFEEGVIFMCNGFEDRR